MADQVKAVEREGVRSYKVGYSLLEALRRMQYVVENIDRASPALLRNNAFKAGNAAGVRLPITAACRS